MDVFHYYFLYRQSRANLKSRCVHVIEITALAGAVATAKLSMFSRVDEKMEEHEHHGDYSLGYIPISSSVLLYTLSASINSLSLGYDIGVSTNLGPLIQNDFDLSDLERELLIGSLNGCAMIGALLSNTFSDRFGRRMSFLIASFGFLNGLIIMALAQSYEQMLAGRMIIGLGCGVGFAVRFILSMVDNFWLENWCLYSSLTFDMIY